MKKPLKIRVYELEAKENRAPEYEEHAHGYKVIATGKISSWTTHRGLSYFHALKTIHDLSMKFLNYTFDLEKDCAEQV